MKILDLDSFSSIEELRAALKELSDRNEISYLLFDHNVQMLTPGRKAREAIATRIAQKLAGSPSHLSELMDRLKNESPEDWA
jgi:hypothetical protein